jgi:integrase
MQLTETKIRALKPREKRYPAVDGDGLELEVMPTGVMVWRYRFRLNGKRDKVTIGRYPAISLRVARIKRSELATTVALGRSPADEKRQAKARTDGKVTVEEFAKEYLREVVAKDRKDATIPRRYIDKAIVPAIGKKAMRDVTTEDVRSIIWAKKDQGRDAAAGAIRGLIKRLFDYGATRGVVAANPVAALPMRHVHRAKARDRVLSADEIRKFLVAASESNIRRQFKVALLIALSTLVRKSELLLARWEHVDFNAAEWHIPAEHSKTRKPHVVYLSRQVIELFRELESLAGGSELVLPSRSSLTKPFARNSLNEALKVALKGTDVPAFTVHDLRRTAATLLHENNWPSDVVEKALNHTIGGVRGVYNRAEYAEQRREMLQFWSDFLDGLMSKGQIVLGRFRPAA